MPPLPTLWRAEVAQAGCTTLAETLLETEQRAVAIQQIPAPTFGEHTRGAFVAQCLRESGFVAVTQDEAGNVLAVLPGQEEGPGLLVTAHLDTVFPQDTDLTVRREGARLWGPGIADNSLGVAGLLALADTLRKHMPYPRRTVWFAANVCEEGLGNLAGMRTVVEQLRERLGAVIVLEGGAFGVVIHGAIGVQRQRLVVETAGGHSWGDFGQPSAIHELCRVGAAIAAMEVPTEPRASFNLGIIEGGTSINTIAARATALLDLRAADPSALAAMADQVARILMGARRDGVEIRGEPLGERPAGGIPPHHPLVEAAVASLEWVGYPNPVLNAASTDANVPLALGLPTVCIGLAEGHNLHRLDEWVDIAPLRAGLYHCFLTLLAALEGLK